MAGQTPTILVIDDDPAVRTTLTAMLESRGYTILPIPPEADLKDAVSNSAYDLLVVDILMPHISGWDLIKAVRSTRPRLPILAISGGGMMVPTDAALKFGKAMRRISELANRAIGLASRAKRTISLGRSATLALCAL